MSNQVDYTAVAKFMERNFKHFNARETLDAAQAYHDHLENGGKMMITLAGAMSTAELGISLAEMIRQDKIDIISCTAANLEEDIYNLVAHDFYKMVPDYRDFSPEEEEKLYDQSLNRVTDTCIPEDEAIRRFENVLIPLLQKAHDEGKRYFAYEYYYQMLRSGALKKHYQIDPKDSWMLAAAEKNIPIVTPGYEDCTTGNIITARVMDGTLPNHRMLKHGLETMEFLADWYRMESKNASIGFFQIGGGIAGDFPICVVPMLIQDMEEEDTPFWGYFCQISDSTTSYGSYSGAVPNEKITWGKLTKDTPKFMINSDATIVAPLIFSYVLGKTSEAKKMRKAKVQEVIKKVAKKKPAAARK